MGPVEEDEVSDGRKSGRAQVGGLIFMLDNIEVVEKFYNFIHAHKSNGITESHMANALGLLNSRGQPSVGTLRLYYNLAACMLISARKLAPIVDKFELQHFINAKKVAEMVEMVENEEGLVEAYSRTDIGRAESIRQFDGYLRENGHRFQSNGSF